MARRFRRSAAARDVALLVAACPVAIASTDADHRVCEWNPAFERMFLLRPGEILGRELEPLIGLTDNADAAAATAVVERGEAIQIRTRARQKNGAAIDIEFHGLPKASSGPFAGYWALFQDLGEQRRVERLLVISREMFKKAFHASPMTVALSSGRENRLIDVNETWVRITGFERDVAVGRTPVELGLMSKEDSERMNELVKANGGSLRDYESRIRARDGRTVVGLLSAQEFLVEGETFRIVVVADVTALRRAEETLSQVTQNMIEAQEWERLRIARDLHDDIGQRLAVWQFGIDRLRHDAAAHAPALERRLTDLQTQARGISADLQALSRELHSPALSLLTIDKTLKRLCDELGARFGIDVEFTARHVPRAISPDVSLCLFRVLQEAITNAAKHSGTTRAVVRLLGLPGVIELHVKDFGSGFSTDLPTPGRGLGLVTMRERVAMVKGAFSVSSHPGQGTEIDVHIPVDGGATGD